MRAPKAGEDARKLDAAFIAAGNVTWCSHSGNWLLGKFLTYIDHGTPESHSWAFNSEKWNLRFTSNLRGGIHSSFICNSSQMGTIQVFLNGWMDKQTVVEQWLYRHNNLDTSPIKLHWVKKPKAVLQIMYCVIPFILHYQNDKVVEVANRCVPPGVREGRLWLQRIMFLGGVKPVLNLDCGGGYMDL